LPVVGSRDCNPDRSKIGPIRLFLIGTSFGMY